MRFSVWGVCFAGSCATGWPASSRKLLPPPPNTQLAEHDRSRAERSDSAASGRVDRIHRRSASPKKRPRCVSEKKQAGIDQQFTTERARFTHKHLYPKIETRENKAKYVCRAELTPVQTGDCKGRMEKGWVGARAEESRGSDSPKTESRFCERGAHDV